MMRFLRSTYPIALRAIISLQLSCHICNLLVSIGKVMLTSIKIEKLFDIFDYDIELKKKALPS